MSPLIESIKCYFAGGLKWEQGAEPPEPPHFKYWS